MSDFFIITLLPILEALKNREKLAEKYINKYEKFLDGENK
jgi:hypothetical protein